jgi:hypothetical protein
MATKATIALPRYRFPAAPFVALAAGAGLAGIAERARSRRAGAPAG